MADTYQVFPPQINGPYENAAAVTPNDTTELTNYTAALYVGATGNVQVDMVGGQANVLFTNVQAGTKLKIRVSKVKATGTSATNIVALW